MTHDTGMPREAVIPIFDTRHPPDADLIDDCVHCGFCLPTCPTFVLWGEEMDTPRGRIYLMKMGNDGQAELNETYVRHFDNCLGCMACLTSCPSGVQYDKLIEATRAQIERKYQRRLPDGLFRRMIFELFPRPERLRILAWPLWFYQRLGIQRLVRRSGLLRLLPQRLQAMESLLPPLTLDRLRATVAPHVAAHGERRLRVGLVLGCVQRAFFGDVNAATARVLAAEGCEVIAPPEQACCGALMVHAGQEADAQTMARRTIDTWEHEDVDLIVINAAGCGSTLKEYGHLLRDDPQYAERAQNFSAKCRDISEVLAELPQRAPRRPLTLRVAYHDACHLQHAQGIRSQPRQLLGAIPGLQVREIPEAAICCGSAGVYNLVEPGPAQQLGDRKVQNILTLDIDAIISANPGCSLQISSGLRRAGRQIPTLHPIQLIDAAIRGVDPLG
ncbi:MAG TPA: heterodisulfide reductase-related iron-sulfur binding cluster [Roseiflexaceae bacterium]|nr:heterodisulfide reductase-related iron-sulfur binding cluster [Roseiflexaceae bacterium]HMP41308.1 heterodisulfide reductase-related iron-sulfur binding cluster [Roseiflexaceae bacterium]